LVDHSTFSLAYAADFTEGVSQEPIALAGHLRLNKMAVLIDDNGLSIYGPLSLADSVDYVKRFEAAGSVARRIDADYPSAPNTSVGFAAICRRTISSLQSAR